MGELSVKNETVFVTGAAGVIGKQVVKVLADSGLKIIAIDRKKNPFVRASEQLSGVEKKDEFSPSGLISVVPTLPLRCETASNVTGCLNSGVCPR